MGYSTRFDGELKFTKELTASQLAKLNFILGEDARDHPEWEQPDLTYIDLELTEDYSGLKHDGAEKTYEMVGIVNFIIRFLEQMDPAIGLEGKLACQGEDIEDRWELIINKEGLAERRDLKLDGKIIECPECGAKFEYKE